MKENKRTYKDIGRHFFIPEHFEFNQEGEMKKFISENPMANLVTTSNGKIISTCVPLFGVIENNQYSIIGHISKRNPQAHLLENSTDNVVLFTSPSAYISPRWFQDISTAPTWSYISVQLRGRFDVLSSAVEAMKVVDTTLQKLEKNEVSAWDKSKIPADRLERLSNNIVAFCIRDIELEGIERLNQDHTMNDRKNIMRELSKKADIGSQFIQQQMLKKM